MTKIIKRLCTASAMLALAVALMLSGLMPAAGLVAMAQPLAAPLAQTLALPLPDVTCALVDGVRTCDLYARAGTLTLPDSVTVPVWGFTQAADPATPGTLPGPVLVVNEGESVQVVFYNELPGETVSLAFPGQPVPPDTEGIGTGANKTYDLGALTAGTYLYEAGLTPNGGRQVGMGLYGALIVRPATANQAYAGAVTAYDQEALLVLSEIDPYFHVNPNGYALETYRAQYWLINGKAYPETEAIGAAAGERVLLRIANAGVTNVSMGLLGLHQTLVAADGAELVYPYSLVAETVGAGQTMDSIVTVPAGAEEGMSYVIYNTTLFNHNSASRSATGALQFGGQFTTLQVSPGAAPGPVGPVVLAASAEPSPTNGTVGVLLQAQIGAMPGRTVVAAEFYPDALGAAGTGTAFSVTPGPMVNVSADISPATLAGLPSGYHAFYIRAQDDLGTWGAPGAAVLNLDKTGPLSINLSLTPDHTNGTRDVLLHATGDDHSTGNQDVVAAEYTLNGVTAPMALNMTAPIVGLSATIPMADLAALPEGLYTVEVTSQDALGNWSLEPGLVDLSLDKTGPATSAVTLTPNTLDLSGPPSVYNIRLDARVEDLMSGGVQSNLATAEAFIGVPGLPGTGFSLFPADGLFDEMVEDTYFSILVTQFAYLSAGEHSVYVRGRDTAGNWGELAAGTITIDRGSVVDTTGPLVTGVTVAPDPTGGAATVTLAGTAADPDSASNIAGAEWWVGTDPGPGMGYPMVASDGAFDETIEQLTATVSVGNWQNGNVTLMVRAWDTAMNFGSPVSVRFRVSGNSGNLVAADSFDAGLDQWGIIGGITTDPAAEMGAGGQGASVAAGLGLVAQLNGTQPAYIFQEFPAGETRLTASFMYDPNDAMVGLTGHNIFVGLDGMLEVFGLQVSMVEGEPDQYRVRAWALDSGVRVFSAWHNIPNGPVALGLSWTATPLSVLSLRIDGVVAEEVSPIASDVYVIDQIRLGPSSELTEDLSGSVYFDDFVLQRQTLIFLPIVIR